MALLEGLASFGISLGAGIVIEGRKLFISNEVQKQINKAFEESLKEYCSNTSILEQERKKIGEIFKTASLLPNSDLRNKEITGDYSKFFKIFESKLVKHDSAYKYLKEIRDETRYQEILKEFKTAIETIKDEIRKNSSSELELEFKRQINQYKSNLESFKPITAFSNLKALEDSFENYNFRPTDVMKSSLEVLKGRCLEYMPEQINEWQKAYIRAYKLNDKSRENLENACYAYYRLDEFAKADQLADKILNLDEYNSKAWAVKSLIKDSEKLCEILSNVPKIVIDDYKFKALIHSRSVEKQKYVDLAEAFSKYNIIVDITEFNGQPTTFENFRDVAYLVNCASIKLMGLFISFNDSIKLPLSVLEPIFEIQQSYLKAINNSEIQGNHSALRFLHSYLQFLMEGEKDYVYKMKEHYTQSDKKESYYTLVLANSLHLIGDIKDAVKIISESEEQTLEILTLKMICYSKLDEIENFIVTAKEFLKGIKDVKHHLVQMFLIAELLYESNLNSRISIDEYIKDKNFDNDDLKNLLIETLKVFKGENESETIQNLNEIWASGSISEVYMQSTLARTFLLLKEYSKSIEVYKEFLDYDKESIDLFRYIQALYLSKSNNSELIKLLKNWRINFSFNSRIIQLEVELKRQLFEALEVIEICEFYFNKDESDEFIITNYGIALNEIDDASNEQFKKLYELAEKIEFNNSTNAMAIAEILIQNKYQKEGLELYYRQALDESNSQARMGYFMACVKCPDEIIKEFDSIKKGHFVKYENNGKISFVEISDKNKKFNQLIGKKVGDIVTFPSDFGNSNKSIVVKRIMNKYLSLHDEIIEEVNNKDPFSQIPMESFNIQDHLKEGSLLDFLNELTGKRDYDPNKLINEYYSGKISFTELVAGEYSKHFIKAFYNLEYDREGLIQYPHTSYPVLNLLKYEYFILDFTSLLRLFELSKNKKVKFTKKFTLTTSTKSMIKAFSRDFVGHSGNQYVLNGQFYKELLDWIKTNCNLKMATSKLDLINALPETARGNAVFELLIDTITLVQELPNSLLISDDTIMLKFFPLNSGKILGTATFCLKGSIDGLFTEEK
jgi:tetratricopeptide (TPR) repeat protein